MYMLSAMLTREQMQNTLIERLFWHTAERDDSKVAHHLFSRKEMDTVYTLDEATLFDFFFHYLREIDVFPLLEDLDPSNSAEREYSLFTICSHLSDESDRFDSQDGAGVGASVDR